MKKMVILLTAVLMLVGCGEKEYFKQIYVEDVKEYMEEDKNGFLLVVNDNGEEFEEYVKGVAESEEIEIGIYNVYQSEEGAEDNRPVLPFDGFDTYNELYYVEDNKVKGSFEVESYEGTRLTEELTHFVKLHQ
ncbi:membrane lipoprotein lipid attachment site-containing protein [Planococcus versutus]|uniref:Uncharacterized protein n=1 Tax=Planococcus versutus TaxID=1302659 RepID=A0A1B1S5Y5_9BACL|nr:membrane lipoprotein lipid attachment site-containing protein [Planococcus versutus]ANU28579.1 hypothetical protein I858_016490 [Planococcus versutus]